VTREQLAWQKQGARKALEYTMRPIASMVGSVRFAGLISTAVEALFEEGEAFDCPPPPAPNS
jgi:hypothetical protein